MSVCQVIASYLLVVCFSVVVSQDAIPQNTNRLNSSNLPSTKVTFNVSNEPLNRTRPVSNAATSVASEGGSVSVEHQHMIKVNHSSFPPTDLPAFEVGQKNDNKTSVPKKDATLNQHPKLASTTSMTNTTTTTTNTTTTTLKPQKPTVTTADEDEPIDVNVKNTPHDVGIEAVTEKLRKTDFVVPIVVVILSVPLVAIIFSVLYKRGADWWQHRHYRRMDFLIEGMYNN